jgi:tetratricopeptide (TPR) repeat protein
MQPLYRVFLSAVSTEFRAARAAVASDLRARGLVVVVQEDFLLGTDTTLRKLHDYIATCEAVVAMIGTRSGAKPPPAAAAPFAAMLPPGVAEASYTQWEVIFARHYGRRLLRFVAKDWQPAEAADNDDTALQSAFVAFLTKTEGLDRNAFTSVAELRAEVLRQDWPLIRTAKPIHPRFRSIGSLFKGRADKMAELRASLTGGGAVAIVSRVQAVHGLGGIGKTRLAVEFGLAHQQDYDALLFVSGDTPAVLDSNLAALAGVLRLPEASATEDAVKIQAALDWLRLNPRWYLVIDNLDTPEALRRVEALLAYLSGGHTVITSRLSDFSGFFEPLHLDVLAPEDAVAFLLERTATKRRRQPDDAAQAAAIAKDLGWLALALEQAGAYIQRRQTTLGAYRQEWASSAGKLLGWFGPGVTDYPRSVAMTWQTSVDRLTPAGRLMLERLAFLAPEPVPEFLLDVPIEGADGEDLPAALDDLAGYSLVTRKTAEPAFTVHRVVQTVTRQSLDEAGARRALTEALAWINVAFTGAPTDVRNWPRLDRLSPHAVAVSGAADRAGIAEPTVRLLNQTARLLNTKARYAEAEPIIRRALAIEEASHGTSHPNVAIRLNNLAQLLKATNRLSEAEPLMRRALAIDEASYGTDHPRVAIQLINLAALLQDTNRLSEAEPLMRRALAIDEASYGMDHPEVATDLNNLAQLLQATNRLSEAEPLMRRALAIDEVTYGADHPRVAIRMSNLAQLLQDTTRLSEAEPLMRRALAIDEASYRADHPRVAIQLNNLAQLLHATNRLSEAEPLMRRALAIDEASYGADHPNVAIRLNNLAQLLQDTNRPSEAEPLMRRALAINEASYGTDHPNVAVGISNLARLLQDTNRLSEAEPLMRRALEIFVNFTVATGHPHLRLDAVISNYTALSEALGHGEEETAATLDEILAPIRHSPP